MHDDVGTPFDRYFAVALAAGRFGHREHLHVAWMAFHHHELNEAISIVGDGLRRTAVYAGAPQKYNQTVTEAWVRLVAHHTAQHPHATFDTLLDQAPGLLDKRLLARHYSSALLASRTARTSWTEPDMRPIPWP